MSESGDSNMDGKLQTIQSKSNPEQKMMMSDGDNKSHKQHSHAVKDADTKQAEDNPTCDENTNSAVDKENENENKQRSEEMTEKDLGRSQDIEGQKSESTTSNQNKKDTQKPTEIGETLITMAGPSGQEHEGMTEEHIHRSPAIKEQKDVSESTTTNLSKEDTQKGSKSTISKQETTKVVKNTSADVEHQENANQSSTSTETEKDIQTSKYREGFKVEETPKALADPSGQEHDSMCGLHGETTEEHIPEKHKDVSKSTTSILTKEDTHNKPTRIQEMTKDVINTSAKVEHQENDSQSNTSTETEKDIQTSKSREGIKGTMNEKDLGCKEKKDWTEKDTLKDNEHTENIGVTAEDMINTNTFIGQQENRSQFRRSIETEDIQISSKFTESQEETPKTVADTPIREEDDIKKHEKGTHTKTITWTKEDIKKDYEPIKTKEGNLQWILAVVAIIFAMACYAWFIRDSTPPVQKEFNVVELFNEKLHKVESSFPSQRPELWRRSQVHISRHLKTASPTEPVSLILTSGRGAERTLGCLAKHLAKAYSSSLNSSVLNINGKSKRSQDSDEVKLDIDNDLRKAFDGEKTAAVIHRFEELPPGSTLIFYRYCDHENAAYKKVFLLFTVMLDEEEIPSSTSLSTVEDMVHDQLKQKFVSSDKSALFNQMDVDKLSGLWSRISHLILPVVAVEKTEQQGCGL